MLFVRLSLSCVCVSVGKKRRGRVMKERTRGKLDTHKPKGRRDGGRGWTMASLRTDSHFLSLLLWSSSIHSRSVVVHVCPSRDSNQMFALIESNRITKSSLVVLLWSSLLLCLKVARSDWWRGWMGGFMQMTRRRRRRRRRRRELNENDDQTYPWFRLSQEGEVKRQQNPGVQWRWRRLVDDEKCNAATNSQTSPFMIVDESTTSSPFSPFFLSC